MFSSQQQDRSFVPRPRTTPVEAETHQFVANVSQEHDFALRDNRFSRTPRATRKATVAARQAVHAAPGERRD